MLKKTSFILLLVSALLAYSFVNTQSEVEEYAAKAAFIYNFTKFVEWKDNALNNSPAFNIGVIGDSPIFEPLEEIAAAKKINNKKINIIKYNNIIGIGSCHILFISENAPAEIAEQLSGSDVAKKALIITEKKGYLENGSAINFLVVDNRIKFEVNLISLNKSNIKASSQLLKLAANIKN